MRQYIIKRLLIAIPVLIAVSILISALIRLVPGDVVVTLIQETGNLSAEDLAKVRHTLGLDRPFFVQYGTWVAGWFRGDLGDSLWNGRPVVSQMAQRIPVTVELALLAMLIATIIAIPVGIISAVRQDTPADYIARLFSLSGLSIPDFVLGTVLVVFVGIWFRWVPPISYSSFTENPIANLKQMMFPAFILGFRFSATSMRMMRSSMLEVLREDYVRTAWAKGLRERAVIFRHTLRNAFIPVITIMGTQLGYLFGGAVIVETIFNLPGLGSLTVDSITQRDYLQLQGNIMFFATVIVLMNLLVDISYAWFDPRIRYGK